MKAPLKAMGKRNTLPEFSRTSVFGDKETNIYANAYKDTSKRFRGFWHLIRIWKGSVIKLIWHDLLLFVVAYALLSLLYREVFCGNPYWKETFELICIYASRYSPNPQSHHN